MLVPVYRQQQAVGSRPTTSYTPVLAVSRLATDLLVPCTWLRYA